MERRLNFEGMVPLLFLKQSNQMINWKNTMPMLLKNCEEKKFTSLIQHLTGIALTQEPQFQYKYYHLKSMVFFTYKYLNVETKHLKIIST